MSSPLLSLLSGQKGIRECGNSRLLEYVTNTPLTLDFHEKKKVFVNGEVVRLSAGLLVDGQAAEGRSLDLLGHFGTGLDLVLNAPTCTFETSI